MPTHGGPGAALGKVADELQRISETLALIEGQGAHLPEQRAPLGARHVREVIAARRYREAFFDKALFSDPAWDMLLDLMAARLEGKRISVSSVCIASAAPASTALRVLKRLEQMGLVERSPDGRDKRIFWIRLSADAAERMDHLLRSVLRTPL